MNELFVELEALGVNGLTPLGDGNCFFASHHIDNSGVLMALPH